MNAVILAAGLGSRFGDVTKNIHKSLLPVDGIPNIERTIGYLKEIGIREITVVTGYLAESFDYLQQKYPEVQLLHNPRYAEYNNLYTFSLAADRLSDTFMIDADVVLCKNILARHQHSVYYTLLRPESADVEWVPITGTDGYVERMDITAAHLPSMLGITYWSARDCAIIRSHLDAYMTEAFLSNPKMYWDYIPVDHLHELQVGIYEVDERFVDEMDTVENYQRVQEKAAALKELV